MDEVLTDDREILRLRRNRAQITRTSLAPIHMTGVVEVYLLASLAQSETRCCNDKCRVWANIEISAPSKEPGELRTIEKASVKHIQTFGICVAARTSPAYALNQEILMPVAL